MMLQSGSLSFGRRRAAGFGLGAGSGWTLTPCDTFRLTARIFGTGLSLLPAALFTNAIVSPPDSSGVVTIQGTYQASSPLQLQQTYSSSHTDAAQLGTLTITGRSTSGPCAHAPVVFCPAGKHWNGLACVPTVVVSNIPITTAQATNQANANANASAASSSTWKYVGIAAGVLAAGGLAYAASR